MPGVKIFEGNVKLTFLITWVFLSMLPRAEAQFVSARATLDSTLTVIGGQMSMAIEVNQPRGLLVNFPPLTDTITSKIEIVRDLGRDTLALENNRLSIVQRYTITSFDSGLHYIPPLRIEYMEQGIVNAANTNALSLRVINPFAVVDPQKGFFDIKGLINLPFILGELWRYRLWLLMLIVTAALAYGAWYYFKNRKIPFSEALSKEKQQEPAHVIALKELDLIKQEKLWQSGQTKQYYTRVTDTLRRYMEQRFNFPAMEQTSIEILNELKQRDLPDDKLNAKMEEVLATADLVKFAKHKPLPDTHDTTLISAYFFVNQTKIEPVLPVKEAAMISLDNEKKKVAIEER